MSLARGANRDEAARKTLTHLTTIELCIGNAGQGWPAQNLLAGFRTTFRFTRRAPRGCKSFNYCHQFRGAHVVLAACGGAQNTAPAVRVVRNLRREDPSTRANEVRVRAARPTMLCAVFATHISAIL